MVLPRRNFRGRRYSDPERPSPGLPWMSNFRSLVFWPASSGQGLGWPNWGAQEDASSLPPNRAPLDVTAPKADGQERHAYKLRELNGLPSLSPPGHLWGMDRLPQSVILLRVFSLGLFVTAGATLSASLLHRAWGDVLLSVALMVLAYLTHRSAVRRAP
jgi:hypothetical protein